MNSRFDGSGASSATTPIAPARLWPARSADARTSRFSGSCSPNVVAGLPGLRADVEVQHDRRREAEDRPQRMDQGAADQRDHQAGEHAEPEHPRGIAVDLRDVDSPRAKPSSHRQLRFASCPGSRREQRVDLLPTLRACSSAGSVTNSPSRSTSALFERRLKSERTVKKTRPNDDRDDQRAGAATTGSACRRTPARRDRRCRSRGSRTRTTRARARDGDHDVDGLLGALRRIGSGARTRCPA